MGKFVLPDDCTMFAKSGTTEFAVISDTGGLYHQGTMLPDTSMLAPLKVLTWGSTAAHTLVGTTLTQDLTNKTLNAGSSPSTATHILVATTVAQTLEHKTLSKETKLMGDTTTVFVPLSAIAFPTTGSQTLVNTTHAQTLENKTLSKETKLMGNTTTVFVPLSALAFPTTGSQTLVNTTDSQTLENKTLHAGCVFASAAGSSDDAIPNYGLTNISASTSPFTATLAAPLAGMLKFIHVSAANTSDVVTIDASTSVEIGVVGSTASYRKMAFTCKGSAMLLGVSTARWDVLSIGTTLVGTATLPTFTT